MLTYIKRTNNNNQVLLIKQKAPFGKKSGLHKTLIGINILLIYMLYQEFIT